MTDTWVQVITLLIGMLTIFFGNLGMLISFRRESREDWLRCQNTIDAIRSEMKDFHERLLKIEMDRK